MAKKARKLKGKISHGAVSNLLKRSPELLLIAKHFQDYFRIQGPCPVLHVRDLRFDLWGADKVARYILFRFHSL